MSFGFSAGDIWEAGKVVIRSSGVVIDANKAPDEYQREIDTSSVLDSSLDHLAANSTSARSNQHAGNVNTLIQNIKQVEQNRKQKLERRYGNKLGKGAPRGRRHGVVQKVRYSLFAPKDEDKHRNDQQGPLNALQTHALGTVLGNQDVQLSAVEKMVNQEQAHHSHLVQEVAGVQATVLERLNESESFRQRQQRLLTTEVDSQLGAILARLEDHKQEFADLRRLMREEGVRISMYGSGRTVGDATGGGSTSPSLAADPPLTTRGADGQTSPRSHTGIPLASTPICKSRKLQAISILKIRDRSMEFTWWNQGRTSRSIFPNVSLADNDEGAFLTFFFVLLGMFLELGLELGRFVSSQVRRHASIPSSVSFLMSDTIDFTDALGRNFKLSVVHSTKWEVFDGWLRNQFLGCPGSAKVQNGKYVIFDARNPNHIITKTSWTHAVSPSRRFQMAIAYEHVQLTQSCPRCDKPFDAGKGLIGYNINICSSCKQRFSTSHSGSMKVLLKRLMDVFARPDQWGLDYGSHHLMVETSVNGYEHAMSAFRKLKSQIREDDEDIDLEEDILSQVTNPVSRVSEPEPFSAGYSHWRTPTNDEVTEDQWLDDDTSDSIDLPTCGPVHDTSEQERHERQELVHFSAVWMQRDDRLHNAALSGDYDATAALIRDGFDVNQRTGRTGSALVAAIASGSSRVVGLLLEKGADPFRQLHQGHTAVSVVACFGARSVAHVILEHAFRTSKEQPGIFQGAVDTALHVATKLHQTQHRRTLLFMGADPTAIVQDGKSAFALVLERKDSPMLEEFLAMLYDRSLLTESEVQAVFSAIERMNSGYSFLETHRLPPWLGVCCAAISAGSSEPLEREMAKRVRKRGGLYFRLNINNLRCHPDIRTFWTRYENERLGIVRPTLLAGMT